MANKKVKDMTPEEHEKRKAYQRAWLNKKKAEQAKEAGTTDKPDGRFKPLRIAKDFVREIPGQIASKACYNVGLKAERKERYEKPTMQELTVNGDVRAVVIILNGSLVDVSQVLRSILDNDVLF